MTNLAGFFSFNEIFCTAYRQEARLAALSRHKIHALELGREKTGKPASVSTAGFFFGTLETAKKKPAHVEQAEIHPLGGWRRQVEL